MSWLKKLRAYLKKESPDQEVLPISSEPEPVLPQAPLPVPVAETEPEELPAWLNNEDTLRDEGVIYGLSGTDPAEKISIISSLYKKKAAPYIQIKEELNERIGELNLILEKKNSGLLSIETRSGETREKPETEENIIRVAAGLILSLGMSVGNYFLIKEGISYGFPNASQWIAWGVFLTGMFSLYYTTSLIHNDDKITWRKALEEFGMPLAASVFVYVQVLPHMDWYKSLAFLFFTFFIFLISGKLLLGSISKLKTEWNSFRKNNLLSSEKALVNTEWKVNSETLEQEMEKIRMDKWKIVSALNEAESRLVQLNAEKETFINLFLSEYNLARNYKEKLSSSQISKILNK